MREERWIRCIDRLKLANEPKSTRSAGKIPARELDNYYWRSQDVYYDYKCHAAGTGNQSKITIAYTHIQYSLYMHWLSNYEEEDID